MPHFSLLCRWLASVTGHQNTLSHLARHSALLPAMGTSWPQLTLEKHPLLHLTEVDPQRLLISDSGQRAPAGWVPPSLTVSHPRGSWCLAGHAVGSQ